MELTAQFTAEACGGGLRGPGDIVFKGVSTDSRTTAPGELFVALDGPRFHGEDFLPAAMARGAAGALLARPVEGLPADFPVVVVEDTLEALGALANAWRRALNPIVVAVSGSAGKTTTKEMTAALMNGAAPVLATEGNKNNLVGLPQTLLRLRPEHRFAVVELGMNRPGELLRLTEIAAPDAVVMTNIGNAHIGNFGSEECLVRAELEVLDALDGHEVVFFNADCPVLSAHLRQAEAPFLLTPFGREAISQVGIEDVSPIDPVGYRMVLRVGEERRALELPLFGEYQVSNVWAAASVAHYYGVGIDRIASRLGNFTAPALRSDAEWIGGVLVVKDCYNASPDPMLRAIASFRKLRGVKRRFALLGDMYELGEFTARFHEVVGRAAAEGGLDGLFAVGEHTVDTVREAARGGLLAVHCADSTEAARLLASELREGDALLVKGSRANRLEQAVERLRAGLAAADMLEVDAT
ncbi:MAG: UDP-N-acetylmuramoyl-tripeptide--D-alanyl-D-alanine ligase [Candidatus Sumerlaeia bacterium]|nr:UDP-N-acetylmuramoyl-tripeptide--D-alanyl-D-alanine ligase [Candidatus Sumerlaeia bacterium]